MRFLLTTIFGLLLLPATTVAADENPSSQWRYENLSLHDLVQNGYKIVSVTAVIGPGGVSVETFFTQKGNGVYKCSETHASDVKAREAAAIFGCWKLVKPYQ